MNSSKQQPTIFINGCGFNSALGHSPEQITACLTQQQPADMYCESDWLNNGKSTVVGKVTSQLPEISDTMLMLHKNTRNNRLALSALQQIESLIETAKSQYGASRIGVVVGTSTSGISDGEVALSQRLGQQAFPDNFHYHQQELGNLGQFVADYYQLTGPAYTISTACSSSGRAFISAQRLLNMRMVDAVIVGGCDSLCKLTLNGFNSLEALSNVHCNPFSENRDGINIGESSAFMLLSHQANKNQKNVALFGVGDSSDAHHISAPHPEGDGAVASMQKALQDADLTPSEVGYINAHGTATPLNDAMEAKAIYRLFGANTPVSSTKPLTGHTLGAAAITEAAICWHILQYGLPLPIQINDGQIGDELADIQLVHQEQALRKKAILSNSFAFGGNNVSLIFGIENEQ
ncbi:beta-ketoacyl-[acyl-carrier-protein] synthase family protein [Aliivibrio kagoshimensis]|uniref:beta-ketoacyl-[acyl-carrier-protein] synthase family protein n=1 Tax=Aliivibrio kagoshimensis TaxID=2910230 RepID=UPI003D0984B7